MLDVLHWVPPLTELGVELFEIELHRAHIAMVDRAVKDRVPDARDVVRNDLAELAVDPGTPNWVEQPLPERGQTDVGGLLQRRKRGVARGHGHEDLDVPLIEDVLVDLLWSGPRRSLENETESTLRSGLSGIGFLRVRQGKSSTKWLCSG